MDNHTPLQRELRIRHFANDLPFHSGPITEASGYNGVFVEDLLYAAKERLEEFQDTPFRCRQNAIAITKIEEALFWLQDRTREREERGVEGTSTP